MWPHVAILETTFDLIFVVLPFVLLASFLSLITYYPPLFLSLFLFPPSFLLLSFPFLSFHSPFTFPLPLSLFSFFFFPFLSFLFFFLLFFPDGRPLFDPEPRNGEGWFS